MLEDNGTALLMAEFHHRVLNSFQVISTLADRCGRVREINDLPPVLEDLAERLAAFAAVHRQLAIPPCGCFAVYCSTLGANLVAGFGRTDTVHVSMDAIELPASWLSRVALIIAELLTNCLKHSLRSTSVGSISLDIQVCHDQLVIEAQDSAAVAITHRSRSPSRVVAALAASLGGDARVVDRQGYCAQVSLPLPRHKGRITSRPGSADHSGPSARHLAVPHKAVREALNARP